MCGIDKFLECACRVNTGGSIVARMEFNRTLLSVFKANGMKTHSMDPAYLLLTLPLNRLREAAFICLNLLMCEAGRTLQGLTSNDDTAVVGQVLSDKIVITI